MTPQEFYLKTVNHPIDLDGNGIWCWDLWAYFCKLADIPLYPTIHCSITGYVRDVWYLRHQNGILNYFDEIPVGQFRDGDWVIWGGTKWGDTDYSMTPLSHVGMYYQGRCFNQTKDMAAYLLSLDFNKALGGFRWKGWRDMDDFMYGVNYRNYEDAELTIYKAPDKCELFYLSAGKDQVQDIQAFDSPDLMIVAAVNGGYFQMRTDQPDPYGTHYGVEQTHDGTNITLAPNGQGLLTWYQEKDGHLGVSDASDYWLPPEAVNFAGTPYSVLIEDGKTVNRRSTALPDKESVKAQQTMIARINDHWFFICSRSAVYPNVMLRYAQVIGAQWALLFDSGGSTQMMAWYGNIYRKEIYTGRKISTAWILAQRKTAQYEPIQEDPQEGGEDTMPVDNGSYNDNVEEPEHNSGGSVLSSETYDFIKKLLTWLGAFETFWLVMIKQMDVPYGQIVSIFIGALIAGLSYLMNSSSAQFWADKDIVQKKEG